MCRYLLSIYYIKKIKVQVYLSRRASIIMNGERRNQDEREQRGTKEKGNEMKRMLKHDSHIRKSWCVFKRSQFNENDSQVPNRRRETFPILPPSISKSLSRADLTRDEEENFWKISIRSTAGKTWHEKIQEYKIRKTGSPEALSLWILHAVVASAIFSSADNALSDAGAVQSRRGIQRSARIADEAGPSSRAVRAATRVRARVPVARTCALTVLRMHGTYWPRGIRTYKPSRMLVGLFLASKVGRNKLGSGTKVHHARCPFSSFELYAGAYVRRVHVHG